MIFVELSSILRFLLFRRVMLLLKCFNGLLGPLGDLWGLFWEAFGGHLGSLGVVLEEVWGRPRDFLRASWPPRRPRCPQDPPKCLPDASRTPPEASQRHPQRRPGGLQEAPDTRHCRCYVLCFHQGQAECAKRLNKLISKKNPGPPGCAKRLNISISFVHAFSFLFRV